MQRRAPTVALVNPQLTSSGWGRGLEPRHMDDVLPRRSLLYLSGPLKAAGCRVELVDLRLLSGWDDYEATLRRIAPDVVGVTAHTAEAGDALECLRRVRRVVPAALTVAGGIHFTMFPSLGESEALVDHVVRGEGEITLPRLVRDPGAFPRVVWGEPPDLDNIPFEDRSLYADYASRTLFRLWELPTPVVDVLAQRGCPWQCRFCCGPGEQNLFTRESPRDPERRLPSFRQRSVANVIAELEELEERYAFRGLIFHDDQLVVRRAWVEQLCDALEGHGFVARGVRWWAASRADVVSRHPELFARMHRAGLQILSIGFESFNDRTLAWLGKGTTRQQNLEAARICRQIGIDLFANVILGVPGADGVWRLEDDLESMRAIEQIKPRHLSPSFFSPIPGSRLHDWAVTHELLLSSDMTRAGSRTPDQARIRGVDYEALGALLEDYRRRHPEEATVERTLGERVRSFMRRPLREKVATVRARLGR